VLEQNMAQAGAELTANRVTAINALTDAQNTTQTAFPTATLSLTNANPLPDDEADTLLQALIEGRPRDMSAGRTLTGPHRADLTAIFAEKGINAKDCSTGEQKALLISLILSNARKVGEDFGAPPIILLDEVAAHLDAERRAALYDEICNLGAQAWMTGTEESLFDTLGTRGQYVEVTDTKGESHIRQKG